MQKYELFSSNNIVPKRMMRKKEIKEAKEPLAELSSPHRRSKAKCQLVQTSYINELNCSCLPHKKHLINRA